MYDKYIYVGINIFKQPVFKSESLVGGTKAFFFIYLQKYALQEEYLEE